MSSYIIAIYDITDQTGYQQYLQGVGEVVARYDGELLVGDFDAKHLEGDKRDVYVVLRFDSEEKAMGWYNDPDYQPLKKIRLASTGNVSTVLAKAMAAPA